MPLKDMAQYLREEIWALFEPILPARIGCGNGRPPKSNRDCFHALLYVLVTGMPWELLPGRLPILQNGPTAVDRPAGARRIPSSLAAVGRTVSNTAWDQLLGSTTGIKSCSTAPRSRLKKGRTNRAFPVDRAQCGTALQLACDGRAMPLGAVVTSANARDGCHTEALLAAWVEPPPALARPLEALDVRSLPTAQADGADGNRPSRARAHAAGFRLQAPSRGQRRPGVGKIRPAVECRHNFFAQFGRIGRRLDRSAQRFLGWIQWAACLIFLRSGFVR